MCTAPSMARCPMHSSTRYAPRGRHRVVASAPADVDGSDGGDGSGAAVRAGGGVHQFGGPDRGRIRHGFAPPWHSASSLTDRGDELMVTVTRRSGAEPLLASTVRFLSVVVIDAVSHLDRTSSSIVYSLPRSPAPVRRAFMCWSTFASLTFVSSRSSPASWTVSPLHAFTRTSVTNRLSFAAGGGVPGLGSANGGVGGGGVSWVQPTRHQTATAVIADTRTTPRLMSASRWAERSVRVGGMSVERVGMTAGLGSRPRASLAAARADPACSRGH